MMIIKYYEWLRFLPDERHAVYEICERDPELKDGVRHVKYIEKEEAKKLIEAKTSMLSIATNLEPYGNNLK